MNKEQEAREAFINYKEIKKEWESNVNEKIKLKPITANSALSEKLEEAEEKLKNLMKYLDETDLIELIQYPELEEEANKILSILKFKTIN
jgi:hypothetical protein